MSGDNDVGYRRPPRSTQFKKGQSGNPRGRPKGSKNMKTLIEEVLRQTVMVRHGERQKPVPTAQAMIMALMKKAMLADIKACELLLKIADRYQLLAPAPEDQLDPQQPAPFAWTKEHESLRPFIEHLSHDDKPIIDDTREDRRIPE